METDKLDALSEIRKKLKKYPELQALEEQHGLSVTPPTGFCVSIHSNGDGYIVGFEGWDEHFKSPEEAMNCFAWGLSNECRLKVTSRGGKPHKWTAQQYVQDAWIDVSTTGLIFFKFWCKEEIIYMQNTVIES